MSQKDKKDHIIPQGLIKHHDDNGVFHAIDKCRKTIRKYTNSNIFPKETCYDECKDLIYGNSKNDNFYSNLEGKIFNDKEYFKIETLIEIFLVQSILRSFSERENIKNFCIKESEKILYYQDYKEHLDLLLYSGKSNNNYIIMSFLYDKFKINLKNMLNTFKFTETVYFKNPSIILSDHFGFIKNNIIFLPLNPKNLTLISSSPIENLSIFYDDMNFAKDINNILINESSRYLVRHPSINSNICPGIENYQKYLD